MSLPKPFYPSATPFPSRDSWFCTTGEPPPGAVLYTYRNEREGTETISIGAEVVGIVTDVQLISWDMRRGPFVLLDWDAWRARKLEVNP